MPANSYNRTNWQIIIRYRAPGTRYQELKVGLDLKMYMKNGTWHMLNGTWNNPRNLAPRTQNLINSSNLRSQRLQTFIYILVAPVDLFYIMDRTFAFCGKSCNQQCHAGTYIRGSHGNSF